MGKSKKAKSAPSTVGRPTDYDPKYTDELIQYFSVPPYTEVTRSEVIGEGEKARTVEIPTGKLVAGDLPTIAGFAAKIGKHRDTLHAWSKIHPEFSDALKRAKDLQENWLVVNGNKGLIPAAFGIFTLKNVSGYRDKLDVLHDKTDEENLTPEQIQARVDALLAKRGTK